MSKKLVGATIYLPNGISEASLKKEKLKADTIAFTPKSPIYYNSPKYSNKDIQTFIETNPDGKNYLIHGSFIVNMANDDPVKYKKMYDCMVDDLNRVKSLDMKLYNIHPGSDVRNDRKKSIYQVIETINKVHKEVSDIIFILENMAGQGRVLCDKFEELRIIIDGVFDKSRIGVCIDTCHMYSAGYDIKNDFIKVWDEFDRIIGFKYLKGMHLNDSKFDLGAKKDRHENLGLGYIGLEPFKMIMRDERFNGIPLILETPDLNLHSKEIRMLKSYELK